MGRPSPTRKHISLTARSKEAVAVRDAIVRKLFKQTYDLCPHLTQQDAPIVRRFCEFEYLLSLAIAEIKRRESPDMFNGANQNLLDNYRRFAQTQLQLANSIGLTPASRAALRIGKESSDDIVAAFARESSQKQLG
jgi:hypothetical protein